MSPTWLPRIALAALTVAAVAAAIPLVRYASWRRALSATVGGDSRLLVTTRGPVEFLTLGDTTAGVPVLWLHGNPGGYDQLSRAVLARAEFGDGLHSIVPSRPGYLRTPLSSGATPEEQAHLFAALLDSLGIPRVAVVGVSGGGPSALQFARLYPARTSTLTLVFAITSRTPPDPVGRRQRLMDAIGLDDWYTWRFSTRFATIPDFDPADTAMVRSAEALLASTVPRARRRAGDDNDQHQFDRPEGWPIDGITAPTLILAGTRDITVPIAQAEFAQAQIPGARLVRVAGDHNAQLTHAREVGGTVRTFILEQAAR